MEIRQEHKTQIEEIISDMECPNGFQYYYSGFEDLCKARIVADGKLIECLDERG